MPVSLRLLMAATPGRSQPTSMVPSLQATCTGLDNSTVFAFFGGAFASIVAFVLLSTHRINKFPFLVISLTSFGIAHFFNAIVEAFFRDWYMTSELAIPVISMTSFGIFVVILLVVGRKNQWP